MIRPGRFHFPRRISFLTGHSGIRRRTTRRGRRSPSGPEIFLLRNLPPAWRSPTPMSGISRSRRTPAALSDGLSPEDFSAVPADPFRASPGENAGELPRFFISPVEKKENECIVFSLEKQDGSLSFPQQTPAVPCGNAVPAGIPKLEHAQCQKETTSRRSC